MWTTTHRLVALASRVAASPHALDVKSNRNNKEKEKKSAKAHQNPFFFLFVLNNELEMEKLNYEDIAMIM